MSSSTSPDRDEQSGTLFSNELSPSNTQPPSPEDNEGRRHEEENRAEQSSRSPGTTKASRSVVESAKNDEEEEEDSDKDSHHHHHHHVRRKRRGRDKLMSELMPVEPDMPPRRRPVFLPQSKKTRSSTTTTTATTTTTRRRGSERGQRKDGAEDSPPDSTSGSGSSHETSPQVVAATADPSQGMLPSMLFLSPSTVNAAAAAASAAAAAALSSSTLVSSSSSASSTSSQSSEGDRRRRRYSSAPAKVQGTAPTRKTHGRRLGRPRLHPAPPMPLRQDREESASHSSLPVPMSARRKGGPRHGTIPPEWIAALFGWRLTTVEAARGGGDLGTGIWHIALEHHLSGHTIAVDVPTSPNTPMQSTVVEVNRREMRLTDCALLLAGHTAIGCANGGPSARTSASPPTPALPPIEEEATSVSAVGEKRPRSSSSVDNSEEPDEEAPHGAAPADLTDSDHFLSELAKGGPSTTSSLRAEMVAEPIEAAAMTSAAPDEAGSSTSTPPPPPPPPVAATAPRTRGRTAVLGRPRKVKEEPPVMATVTPDPVVPKRGRGRPRIRREPPPEAEDVPPVEVSSVTATASNVGEPADRAAGSGGAEDAVKPEEAGVTTEDSELSTRRPRGRRPLVQQQQTEKPSSGKAKLRGGDEHEQEEGEEGVPREPHAQEQAEKPVGPPGDHHSPPPPPTAANEEEVAGGSASSPPPPPSADTAVAATSSSTAFPREGRSASPTTAGASPPPAASSPPLSPSAKKEGKAPKSARVTSTAPTPGTGCGGSAPSHTSNVVFPTAGHTAQPLTAFPLLTIDVVDGQHHYAAADSSAYLAHTRHVSQSIQSDLQKPAVAALDTSLLNVVTEQRAAKAEVRQDMRRGVEMVVASSRLRGDALYAGVQALQQAEVEESAYRGEDAVLSTLEKAGPADVTPGVLISVHGVFPRPPPPVFLPVSGVALVEAQHRLSFSPASSATATATAATTTTLHATEGVKKEVADEEAEAGEVRYKVEPDGIPEAPRIPIDHTFHLRGSFAVQPTTLPSTEEGGEVFGLPTVADNPEESLHPFIYRRYLSPDMKRALDGQGTLLPGVTEESGAGQHSTPSTVATGSGEAGSGGSGGGVGSASATTTTSGAVLASSASSSSPQAGAAEGEERDIDKVLKRGEHAIKRIPMPDVEWSYGPTNEEG